MDFCVHGFGEDIWVCVSRECDIGRGNRKSVKHFEVSP